MLGVVKIEPLEPQEPDVNVPPIKGIKEKSAGDHSVLGPVLGVVKIEPLEPQEPDVNVPHIKGIKEKSERAIHPLDDFKVDTYSLETSPFRDKLSFSEKERKAILNMAKTEIESCKISKAIFARKVLDRSVGILSNVFRYDGKGYEQHVETIKNFFEKVPITERYRMYTSESLPSWSSTHPDYITTKPKKYVTGISILSSDKYKLQGSAPLATTHGKDRKGQNATKTPTIKPVEITSNVVNSDVTSKVVNSIGSPPTDVLPKSCNGPGSDSLTQSTGKLNKSLSLIQMSVIVPKTSLVKLPGNAAVQITIKQVSTKMPMRYAKTYTFPDYMNGNPTVVIPYAAKNELDRVLKERDLKPTDDACKYLAKKLRLSLRTVQVYVHHKLSIYFLHGDRP